MITGVKLRIRRCKLLQSRSAITIPLLFRSVLILHNFDVLPQSILRHENCHVKQYQRWGLLKYYAKHIWARVVTRSIFAYNHPIERECYDLQDSE